MEAAVYKHLEKAEETLSEMQLGQVQQGNPAGECCQAKNRVREAIVLARTVRSLESFATAENYTALFTNP